ncbi:DUF2569 domain-containing protein [Reyranella sp. CPCC 100927]|uniref:DUF2569 domain-containing protein n=1 Tax=Reyranella sp. CPCC 100927 TaxID=2599616 RepID=UPI0011B6331B|nr:DUF2569 domain-containing protein [Reyranella sp. CPCC 100927]TWT11680.1 DUF2569 domain-containing protein [Reyranella sp. CPCC 100927]
MTESNPSTEAPSPSGIGGWLILPMLGLLVTPVRMAIEFYLSFVPVLFSAQGWDYVSSPDRHAWFRPFIIAECVVNVALFVFTLWLIYLFFTKARRVPGLFITWLVATFLAQVADVVGAAGLLGSPPTGADVRDLGRSLVSAIIWIPYFMVSKRVKNTFVQEGWA